MEITTEELEENILKVNIGDYFDIEDNQVKGELKLDVKNTSNLVYKVISLLERETENKLNIIINLENIAYMDSSGLWSLVEINSKAKLSYHNIFLINVTEYVSRLMDITKMSGRVTIFKNLEEAQKHIRSHLF